MTDTETVKKVAEAIEAADIATRGADPIGEDDFYRALARAAISAMSGWRDIDDMPAEIIKNRTEVLLDDGLGVVVGSHYTHMSFEEWWETVGEPDEEPDHEGYEEYLSGEPEGWCRATLSGVEYIYPKRWAPLPLPPEEE